MTDDIKPITILRGHTSMDTAYLVDDYPYGYRLRCQIRYWVDTATKGAKNGQQRFMSQTTNPKVDGIMWNKPKGSTYSPMVWMYLDDDKHVQQTSVSDIGVTPESDARLRLRGIYEQMTDKERALYDALVNLSKRYPPPWERFDRLVTEVAEHIQRTGEEPRLDNGSWIRSERRDYIGEHDLSVYLTRARQQLHRAMPEAAEQSKYEQMSDGDILRELGMDNEAKDLDEHLGGYY
jgi:hypothetical protein